MAHLKVWDKMIMKKIVDGIEIEIDRWNIQVASSKS